jgi:hypothetical protein
MLVREERNVDIVILLHARTLALEEISCEGLLSRGAEIANHVLGYTPTGIVKGSQAASGMSVEAKSCGGILPSLKKAG